MLWNTRDKISCDDIPGTKVAKKYVRTSTYSSLNYDDVTQFKFKTKRHIHPLDPVYEIKYKNG